MDQHNLLRLVTVPVEIIQVGSQKYGLIGGLVGTDREEEVRSRYLKVLSWPGWFAPASVCIRFSS